MEWWTLRATHFRIIKNLTILLEFIISFTDTLIIFKCVCADASFFFISTSNNNLPTKCSLKQNGKISLKYSPRLIRRSRRFYFYPHFHLVIFEWLRTRCSFLNLFVCCFNFFFCYLQNDFHFMLNEFLMQINMNFSTFRKAQFIVERGKISIMIHAC